MTSWREAIADAMKSYGETWADVEACTLDAAGLDRRFNDGYGGTAGRRFTVWTARSVYFPVCYDGSEWVGRMSRHTDGEPTEHIGGG